MVVLLLYVQVADVIFALTTARYYAAAAAAAAAIATATIGADAVRVINAGGCPPDEEQGGAE